jgi:hypothetical protein
MLCPNYYPGRLPLLDYCGDKLFPIPITDEHFPGQRVRANRFSQKVRMLANRQWRWLSAISKTQISVMFLILN